MFSLYSIISSSISSISVVEWVINMRFVLEYGFMWFSVFIFYWKEEDMTNSYIALDLETTGLEARLEKITEIAALRVVDGRVEERFVTLVNPMRQLGERIRELTGITDDMVKDAPVIGDIIGDVSSSHKKES